MAKKILKKTKDELDILSKDEFKDYRYKYIESMSYPDKSDEVIYLDELEVYELIRFKDDFFAMYERWKEECIKWEKDGKDLNDLTYRGKKLAIKVDTEYMYNFTLQTDLKKVTPLQFIILDI